MKKITIMFLSIFLLCACMKTNTLKRYSRTTILAGFDTSITLHAYCESEEKFNQYFDLAEKTFQSYHQLFDPYHTYKNINNLKTINDLAGKQAVIVDQKLFDLITLSKQFAITTNQHFDITYGAVLSLWHDAREVALKDPNKATIPSSQALSNAQKNTGFQFVELNHEQHSVFIKNKYTSIDLGGIAKGYATQKVAEVLKQAGLKHGILDAGGNVKLIGSKPEGNWNVGIQIPDFNQHNTTSLLQVSLNKEFAFVTSGDYQRFFEIDGIRYHHIIDPTTNHPAHYARSVTVIHQDSTIADALSTALYTMSYHDGIALLQTLKKQNIEVEVIWVFDKTCPAPKNVETKKSGDYTIVITDGIKDHTTIS